MYLRYYKIIFIWILLLIVANTIAQTNTEQDAFTETFIKIFQNRGNRFDSITNFQKIIDGSYDAEIKLPGADKCVIKFNKYIADYGFNDKGVATSFFKKLQNWLNYAAGAYNSNAIFLPHFGNQEHIQFFFSDSSGFIDAENYLRIITQKTGKPLMVQLEIDSEPDISFYVGYGNKINNTALKSLVNDIGFGKDIQMNNIKKNQQENDDGYTYESSRSLPGYKATIYEYTDDVGSENKLQLLTKWTGPVQSVNSKVDSLILMLKAALPASFCYRIDANKQTVFFYQHPFARDIADAGINIHYGINEGEQNSYYAAFIITRFLENEPEKEIAEPALYPFTMGGGKFGYKDGSGKIIVPEKYDQAASFKQGRACVVLNKRYGYINAGGREIVPLQYDYASLYFFDGIAEISLNRKWGLVDTNGKEIVTPRYDEMQRGKIIYDDKVKLLKGNNFILVELSGKTGFIDYSGREIIPLKYEGAAFIEPDKAIVKFNGFWGIIDMKGKLLVPPMYDFIHTSDAPENEYISPRLNNKYGLMHKSGKLIIPVKYDQVSIGFSENLSRIELNDKFGFVDKTGKEVIIPKYENVDDFSNGLAQAKLHGKWGFIDKTGKEIIPFTYESTGNFKDGLAPAALKGKWGFINKSGKTVIAFTYDAAYEFDEYGEAKVFIGEKWGKINAKGIVVTPIINEDDEDEGW